MEQREQTGARQASGSEKAARVDLSEFAEALSSGVVKALERRSGFGFERDDFRPWWVWAGWIIGTNGQGPIVGGDGPFGGGPSGGGAERPGG